MKIGDKILNFTENETIINDGYPVNWNFFYIIDGKVFRSDVKGTIYTLKRDLLQQGKITTMNVEARLFDMSRLF